MEIYVSIVFELVIRIAMCLRVLRGALVSNRSPAMIARLSRVPYFTSIGQNGKNSCDVDSHFVVYAYVYTYIYSIYIYI